MLPPCRCRRLGRLQRRIRRRPCVAPSSLRGRRRRSVRFFSSFPNDGDRPFYRVAARAPRIKYSIGGRFVDGIAGSPGTRDLCTDVIVMPSACHDSYLGLDYVEADDIFALAVGEQLRVLVGPAEDALKRDDRAAVVLDQVGDFAGGKARAAKKRNDRVLSPECWSSQYEHAFDNTHSHGRTVSTRCRRPTDASRWTGPSRQGLSATERRHRCPCAGRDRRDKAPPASCASRPPQRARAASRR